MNERRRFVKRIELHDDAVPVKDFEWVPMWYESGPLPTDYDPAVQEWKYAIKLNHWVLAITVSN